MFRHVELKTDRTSVTLKNFQRCHIMSQDQNLSSSSTNFENTNLTTDETSVSDLSRADSYGEYSLLQDNGDKAFSDVFLEDYKQLKNESKLLNNSCKSIIKTVKNNKMKLEERIQQKINNCLLYTSPSPRDA